MTSLYVFKVGDRGAKRSGFRFPGIVAAIFPTKAGKIRVVVEAEHHEFEGMLHIYSPELLVKVEGM